MKILAHTSFIGETGYANHARSFFCALNKHHTVKVRNYTVGSGWKGMGNTPHDNEPYITSEMKEMLILQTLSNNDKSRSDVPMYDYDGNFNPDVHIILMENDHYYFYDDYDGYKIGYCVYESTRFPEQFFKRLHYFDEMWVPTQWQADSLIDQGYPKEKVHVVTEGVNVDVFKPIDKIPKKKKFRFLYFGRWDYRKSTTEVLKAFGETFKNYPNVELIASVENSFPSDGTKSTKERMKKYGVNYKNIKYVKFLEREEYTKYLQEGDVFLSCARSEGWNLPLIEAMSSGIPTIYSNWGGQLQFATGKGVPVNISHLRPANIFDSEVEGEYCEPDFDDLKEKMFDVYCNYDGYRNNALLDAEIIHKDFNWDKVAQDASKILESKFDEDFNGDDDIFVIGQYVNSIDKENSLISLINRLKNFNVPIILAGHYPVSPEIQKMVDYYLFDKDNPTGGALTKNFWTETEDYKIENTEPAHDYTIWSTMRNAINFAKYLNKKNIHYIDYDCDIDLTQYKNEFMLPLKDFDASVMENHFKDTSDKLIDEYETYVFSIKTDVALTIFNSIKTKEEYAKFNQDDFILERVFYKYLSDATNRIYDSKYRIINLFHMGTVSGVSSHLMCDKDGGLYYFFDVDAYEETFTVTVDYNGSKNEHVITGGYIFKRSRKGLPSETYKKFILRIGEYKQGKTVKAYYKDEEISSTILNKTFEDFSDSNNINFRNKMEKNAPDEASINFIDGPFVEIKDKDRKFYDIEFIDTTTGEVVHQSDLQTNHWVKANKKYYVDWKIRIRGLDTDFFYEHKMDLNNRRVLIGFESKSLGDTLAWIPYVEKFRTEHNCDMVCSTFHNKLFRDQYPNIEFAEPGTEVRDIYALYRLGWFRKDDDVDYDRNKTDPKTIALTKTASDILGLDYIELKPLLPVFTTEKKKVVSIAIHSTAQSKYWNNPTGWQDVVDHLNSHGYEVQLLSMEKDGYMGNKHPKNITIPPSKSLEDVMKILQESELFIGISSGLSWLSWAVGTETVLISGFSEPYTEPLNGVRRIINKDVCHGCFNRHILDAGDWNWCPDHKGTDRQFECSKEITSATVIEQINLALGL